EDALTDDHMRVRQGAATALARVLGEEAVPSLQEALADPRSCRFAADALGALGPAAAPAVPDLERLKAAKDPPVPAGAERPLARDPGGAARPPGTPPPPPPRPPARHATAGASGRFLPFPHPAPGASDRRCRFGATPFHASASAGGAFFSVMFGHCVARR